MQGDLWWVRARVQVTNSLGKTAVAPGQIDDRAKCALAPLPVLAYIAGMRTDTPQPVRLSDYRPFPFLIETTSLEFQLDPSATRVKATLSIKPHMKEKQQR